MHPTEYNNDMLSILGFVLKHDDSVNDRSVTRFIKYRDIFEPRRQETWKFSDEFNIVFLNNSLISYGDTY